MMIYFQSLSDPTGTPIPPERGKFKIILIAGQSNAVGRSPIAEIPSNYLGIKNNIRVEWVNTIKFYDEAKFTINSIESGLDFFGYPIVFLDQYQSWLNQKIFFIQEAAGGTGLADETSNSKGNWNRYSTTGFTKWYNQLQSRINVIETYMDLLYPDNYEWHSIVWTQGEYDALFSADAAAYLTNLTDFMDGIRANTDADMKVIITALSTQTSYTYKNTIRQAQQDYAALSENNYFFETSSYELADGVHYSSQGNIDLGDDLFEFYKTF